MRVLSQALGLSLLLWGCSGSSYFAKLPVVDPLGGKTSAVLKFTDAPIYDFDLQSVNSLNPVFLKLEKTGDLPATEIRITSPLSQPFSFHEVPFPGRKGTCDSRYIDQDCKMSINFTPVTPDDRGWNQRLEISYFDGRELQTTGIDIHGAGTNLPALWISEWPSFDFGMKLIGQPVTQVFDVFYAGEGAGTPNGEARGVSFKLAPPFSWTSGKFPGLTAAQGGCPVDETGSPAEITANCKISVTFIPALAKLYSDAIRLTYNNHARAVTVERPISGQGVLEEVPATLAVTASPGSNANFGRVVSLESYEATFDVSYRGTLPAIVTPQAFVDASPFIFKGGYPGEGGTCGLTVTAPCTLKLKFEPKNARNMLTPYTDRLSLKYSSGNVKDAEAGIDLAGEAGDVALVVSDPAKTSHDFGQVNRGNTSAEIVFTLKNQGTFRVDATAVQVTGPTEPTFLFSTNCRPFLAAEQSCAVKASFRPVTAGIKTGSFELSYFDGKAVKKLHVDLQGEGLPTPAKLELSTTSLGFDRLVVGKTLRKDLTITNSGELPATDVQQILTPASPFSQTFTDCGVTLAGKASCKYTFEFAPTSVGPFSTQFQVRYNDNAVPTPAVQNTSVASLTGFGGKPAKLFFDAVASDGDFGALSKNFPFSKKLTLGVTSQDPNEFANRVHVTKISLSPTSGVQPGGNFSFKGGSYPGTGGTCGPTLAYNQTCTVMVEFRPKSVGSFRETLRLNYDTGEGAASSPAEFEVFGDGIADAKLVFNPDTTLTLTKTVIGNTIEADLPVLYYGENPAQNVVISVEESGGQPTATPFTIEATRTTCVSGVQAACNVRVVFAPTQSITRLANIRIDYEKSAGIAASQITRGVSGAGKTPAALALSAPRLDFPDTLLFDSKTLALTLTNTGETAASSFALSGLTGVFTKSSSSTCGTSLGAGASCLLRITFSPTSTGIATSTVGIQYPTGVTSELRSVQADLQGNGLPFASLSLSAEDGDTTFGTGALGSVNLSQWLVLKNDGTAQAQEIALSIAGTNAGSFSLVDQSDCSSGVLAAGASCRVLAQFSPQKPGRHVASFVAGYSDATSGRGPQLAALAISGIATVSSEVAANGEHTCATTTHGRVKCWGRNNFGQLGNPDISIGNTERGDQPGEMADALPWVELGADRFPVELSNGHFHSCAILDNGQVKCWGRNNFGQLGIGTTGDRGKNLSLMGDALPAVNLGAKAVKIAAGYTHTCALLEDGKVKCWGDGADGKLGTGDTNNRGLTGAALTAVDLGTDPDERPTEIVASAGHTCVLLKKTGAQDGRLKCWGNNFYGQLGLGDTNSRGDDPSELGSNLPAIDLGGRKAQSVVVGGGFTCALAEGDVSCWGYNEKGNLGALYCENKDAISGPCWEEGFTRSTLRYGAKPGQMGEHLPKVDLGAGRKAKQLLAGNLHVCAVLENDGIKCWGSSALGELGLSSTLNRGDAPGTMGDQLPFLQIPAGAVVRTWSSANLHSCVVMEDEKLYCWGDNHYGKLGQGSIVAPMDAYGDGAGESLEAMTPIDLGGVTPAP